MSKTLTINQQEIIALITEEFTRDNELAKKVNVKDTLTLINDRLKQTQKEKIEVDKHNQLEAKKLEVFLDDIIEKVNPIIKKHSLKVNKSYTGKGCDRSVYLNLSYNSKTEAHLNPMTATLCVEGRFKALPFGNGFYKNHFERISVGYPIYYNPNHPIINGKDVGAIIEAIVEWVIYYKEKEIK